MITTEDQDSLFRLISSYLKKDIHCYAFGGNAMMYYGYKTSTKDIDLIFETAKDVEEFVGAISVFGYKKSSTVPVYPSELQKERGKPAMYTRGEERFDIFLGKVFQTALSNGMKNRFFARHDYLAEKFTLTVFVLSKEDIILLKSITRRERDFDDIRTIVEKEGKISWDTIIDEAVSQSKRGDKWALIDLEETMQRLKNVTFIQKKYFDRLYKSA